MMRPFTIFDGLPEACSGLWAAWEIKAAAGMTFITICSLLDIDEKILTCVCIALAGDFLLGMLDAFKRGRFRCRAVAFGVTKIFWYGMFITIMALLNRSFSMAVGLRLPLLDLFVAYLVASDCVSMTGHLHSMGVPVPPLLTAIAYKIRKTAERKAKKIIEDAEPKKEGDNAE